LGVIDLKEGKIEQAKMKFDELDSIYSKLNAGRTKEEGERYRNTFLAEIKLYERDLNDVFEIYARDPILKMTAPLPWAENNIKYYNMPMHRDVLAKAFAQKGDLEKAIAEYERLTTFDPESKDRRLIHPLDHYRLAILYEKKGWDGKAIEHYEKFLEFWKDADPGLPEPEDARMRLEKLKVT
jgi:tetratricopeptide (TPR) repeat protein